MMFDQRGTTFDPITVVAIENPVMVLDSGMVDMPADDTVHAAFAGLIHHQLFKATDVFDGVFDLVLQERRHRPVAEAQRTAAQVEPAVEREQEAVGVVAHERQPLGVLDHGIELVAVQNEKALAVGGDVDNLVDHGHVAEAVAAEIADALVVVAWNEIDTGSLARLAQQLLHHVVVALIPVPRALQAPDVDDVTDQIQVLAFSMAEEVEQEFRFASARSEMNVGNPDRSKFELRRRCCKRRVQRMPFSDFYIRPIKGLNVHGGIIALLASGQCQTKGDMQYSRSRNPIVIKT